SGGSRSLQAADHTDLARCNWISLSPTVVPSKFRKDARNSERDATARWIDEPVKILQLLEAAATGAGRHVVDLTEGLLARGHEVHLAYSPLRCDQMFIADLGRL